MITSYEQALEAGFREVTITTEKGYEDTFPMKGSNASIRKALLGEKYHVGVYPNKKWDVVTKVEIA
jgi:hypothetical protein